MLNLTFLSLSISSLNSFSPFSVGNRVTIDKAKFQYFFSTIFYQPEILKAGRTNFKYGTGSILYSTEFLKENGVCEYFNYSDNVQTWIDGIEDCKFVNIHDCTFYQIHKDKNLIYFNNKASFYMTSCTFNQCYCKQTIIQITATLALMTHICCFDLKPDNDFSHQSSLFLNSDTGGSSLRFIYNTFYGGTTDFNKNKALLKFQGRCPIRFQCNNISSFTMKGFTDVNFIDFTGPECLIMLMNTMSEIKATRIIYDNLKEGIKTKSSHFVSYCNFLNNQDYDNFFYINLDESQQMQISECVFKNAIENKNYFCLHSVNKNMKVYVYNCIFSHEIESNNKNFGMTDGSVVTYILITSNKNIDSNPKIHDLAHYVVENVCQGEVGKDAHGCNNDTCPENVGCPPGAFDPKPNEYTYTEKYQPDIHTPPPTPSEYFSRSFDFTYSKHFTCSSDFTKSSFFSRSAYFTETDDFSKSSYFTKTTEFTETGDFSKSYLFSDSSDFTKSSGFSSSFFFSESIEFTETGDFSKSTLFSESKDFTKSSAFSSSFYFSGSAKFTETSNFSKSIIFTESTKFTKTGAFSESFDFTSSDVFDPTEDFNHSKTFSPSPIFSKSLAFSKSNDFSFSIGFSESSDFTKTEIFSLTDYFTQTGGFSSSLQFSTSFYFTKSNDFKETKVFSSSFYFSESSAFSETSDFSESSDFTYSNEFAKTDEFTKSNDFAKTSGFTKTGGFTESKIFTKTGDFSFSAYFTDSNTLIPIIIITKSNVFTQSFDFTESNIFSLSKDFTDSNGFTSSQTLKEKSAVLIDIKTDESNSISTGIKIGVGFACGAAVVAAIIVGLFLLRRRKIMPVEDLNEESIDLHEDTLSAIVTQNPLNNLLSEDDPFEDEFN